MALRTGDRAEIKDVNPTAEALVAGLARVGYWGSLLQRDYGFSDWFQDQAERVVAAAAFAETPISYDSACIGVVNATAEEKGSRLIDGIRALCAPIALEVDGPFITEWEVSRSSGKHRSVSTIHVDQLESLLARRAVEWKPQNVLRSKNIGAVQSTQPSLFTGLVPQLEGVIQERLEPLLLETLAATREAYRLKAGRNPDAEQLFMLVFWLLTAKVFHDRAVAGFEELYPDPDDILAAVGRHYGTAAPRLLNKEARQTAALLTWEQLDFRNLSVEVLSQIWSSALVDKQTRERLGIHRTSRSLVRYIVERIPFEPTGDDERVVFEPCAGSSAFLIGAMQVLRRVLFGESAEQRHKYFVRHLIGAELDPFGVEISRLALTLADFPNPNGWNLMKTDVFAEGAMTSVLRRSAVVLCNPPFEEFTAQEERHYTLTSKLKPAELLTRVLRDLHPAGVLGFVLPRTFIDGRRYKQIRERLAQRFASLDFVVLPDRAFEEADVECTLMVATDPIPHDVCRVAYRRVNDTAEAWNRFELDQSVSAHHSANFGTTAAREGFAIPELQDVWEYLRNNPRLSDVADVHRGLEWKEFFTKGVRSTPADGFMKGVAPHTNFSIFEVPHMQYLSVREQDQRRNAYKREWTRPKAIFNKTTRSRGPWRLAAFADREGVTCAQTYNAAWPKGSDYDEVMLAAVLNGPVANAFVSTREGKTDITKDTLREIPMPVFTPAQRERLVALVAEYERRIQELFLSQDDSLAQLLLSIDALVLDGYRLPARLEHEVLAFFEHQERPVHHRFAGYGTGEQGVFFSLSQLLDTDFRDANMGNLRRQMSEPD